MATLENLLSQAIVERLGWTLIHFVWQAAAIALLLALVLKALHKHSASLRYIVACLALVLIVALPLVTMALVEVSGPIAEAGPAPIPIPIADATPVEMIEVAELPAMPLDAAPLEMADVTVRVPWTQRAATALEPALPYLVCGWLLGVFGLSAWHLGGWAQLQRMKQRMVCDVAAPLRTQLAALSEKLGVRRAVGLLESALVEVPTVVGWIKPVILLPASALSGLSTEQLEAILAHELAHVRRHDYLVNIVQTVVEILGFYHPALWWVSHRIRAERENCCDDLAVQVCGDSVRYARALTCLEEMRHHGSELAVAASGGSLVARIGRLLGQPAPSKRRLTWLPGLIALLLVASIVIPAALVLATPNVPTAMEGLDTKPSVVGTDAPDVGVTVPAQTQKDGEQQDSNEILIDFVLAKVLTDATLDRETILLIGNLLAAEQPQIMDEIFGLGSKQDITVGEILQVWVARRLLTPATTEALVALLESRGYVDVQSRPHVLTRNNVQAQIVVGSEVPILPAGAPASSAQYIDLGITVQATPHLSSPSSDRITLEIATTWTERTGEAEAGDHPAVRTTEIASTVTTRRDRYSSLLIEPDNTEQAQPTNSESILVMFRADSFEPPSATQAQQGDAHPRQVLLDVRTVVIEQNSLLNLGVEWSFPSYPEMFGTPSGPNERPGGVEIGYTPDKTFTDSLQAALKQLRKQGRAQLLARQQVVTLNGQQARVRAITEERYTLHAPATADQPKPQKELVTITSGTILSATPRIGDNNEITLKIAVEYSDSIPPRAAKELPVITRRTTRNVVTVQDGGTVALAGLSGRNTDAEEIAIFVTASLAPENSPPARPEEISVSLPPTVRIDREGERLRREMILARQEYVNSDPSLKVLQHKAAELEADLIAAQQNVLPNHPKIVQDRKLLEAIRRRLEFYRKELGQRFDADLTRRLGKRRTESEPQNQPETGDSSLNPGVGPIEDLSGGRVERSRFVHTDLNGQVDREFGYEELIHLENGQWAVRKPYLSLPLEAMRCHVTADRGQAHFETASDLSSPSGATFSGNVSVVITPSDPNGANLCILALDETTFSAGKGCLSSSGPVRFVCGGTELIGRGLELFCGPAPTRPNGTPIKTVEGIDLYLGPANSFVVTLSDGQPERPELDQSAQVRVLTEATDNDASSTEEKTQIMVDFAVLKVPTDRPLTPEAAARLSRLWDRMYAKRQTGRAERASLPSVEALQISPQELLARCAENGQGDSDALEIMTDLLVSLEYVRVAMNPRVQVVNGQQAEISSKQHVPDPTAKPGASAMIDCGTVLKVTPYAGNAGRITLDIAAEITDLRPTDGAGETPRIGKYSLNTKAVVDSNKTLVLRLKPATEAEVQDEDALYLLIRPRIVPPEPAPDTVTATFQGTDLRRALEEVAAMAGANLMYDANLSGQVWAELQDMPLEKALDMILAGTPYVVRPMPDGYAITKRETWPTGSYAAAAMFVAADDEDNTTTYYARILFDGGSPAVIEPAPWPAADTRILIPLPGRGITVGQLDANGYVTLRLKDGWIRALEEGRIRLIVQTPRPVKNRWEEAAELAFEKLSKDEKEPSLITIKRPALRPKLALEQLASRPIPEDWTLKYTEYGPNAYGRDETAVLIVALSSPAPDNETHELRLYSLDGVDIQPIMFGDRGSSHLLQKADKCLAIHSRSKHLGHSVMNMRTGPFLLDLSRPGRHILSLPAKSGPGEINGNLEDCYAVNFQRVRGGASVSGYVYKYPAQRYVIDGLPSGTYQLSAVTQRQEDNVFVRRAEVTVDDGPRTILNLRDPDIGTATLTGTIHGAPSPLRYGERIKPQWYVLIRVAGSGPVTTTDIYEAQTMDTLYVVRGRNIVQETPDLARFHIQGIAPGTYTVTAIEQDRQLGAIIRRQQSQPLVLNANEAMALDFDLTDRAKNAPAIQVEAWFLHVGTELVDALQQGLPIESVTSDEDIEALHAIGAVVSEEQWIALSNDQTQLLKRVVQSRAESRALACPQVSVLAGESAEARIGVGEVWYTAGYDEPNDSPGAPMARQDTIRPGLALEITASLLSETQIALDGSVTLKHLSGFEDRTYRDEHIYQVPLLDEGEILIEDVHLDNGQTALLLRSAVTWPLPEKDLPEAEEAQPLLILIRATKTQVDEDESDMQSIPFDPAHLPGGMGAFAPGQPPLPPPVQK